MRRRRRHHDPGAGRRLPAAGRPALRRRRWRHAGGAGDLARLPRRMRAAVRRCAGGALRAVAGGDPAAARTVRRLPCDHNLFWHDGKEVRVEVRIAAHPALQNMPLERSQVRAFDRDSSVVDPAFADPGCDRYGLASTRRPTPSPSRRSPCTSGVMCITRGIDRQGRPCVYSTGDSRMGFKCPNIQQASYSQDAVKKAPSKPGVYGIFTSYDSCIYVGSSFLSIRNRVREHVNGFTDQADCIDGERPSCFVWELEEDFRDRFPTARLS